jgi:hypothetical protein
MTKNIPKFYTQRPSKISKLVPIFGMKYTIWQPRLQWIRKSRPRANPMTDDEFTTLALYVQKAIIIFFLKKKMVKTH